MSTNPTNATFIYPPPKPAVPGQTSLSFNYIDTVNVSWTGDDPESFVTALVLCQNVSPGCGLLSNMNVSGMGWIVELMNLAGTYPYTARFNLVGFFMHYQCSL